ncbi:MAG: thioredoxin family protein [Sedimentisphaerales bacterium]|nr:thioredoxin family protein [Sedimentisphaerales bacterium]
MNKIGKTGIVVVLVMVVAIVMVAKHKKTSEAPTISNNTGTGTGTITFSDSDSEKPNSSQQANKPLPRLVDLGADKCIPCKMMAPILEKLKEEYAGRLKIEFIDVWKNPDAGKKYGIKLIPTQIFYDPDGKELFRHEGFFSREDILGKWKESGYDFSESAESTSQPASD